MSTLDDVLRAGQQGASYTTGGSSGSGSVLDQVLGAKPSQSTQSKTPITGQQQDVGYNKGVSLDTRDLKNAAGSLINPLGVFSTAKNLAMGLAGLGATTVGGGWDFVKALGSGDAQGASDIVGRGFDTAGNILGAIKDSYLGLGEAGAGTLLTGFGKGLETMGVQGAEAGVKPYLDTLFSSGYEDRINSVKHRLESEGAASVLLDLYPIRSSLSAASKATKLGSVLDEAGNVAKTGAAVADDIAITQRLENLVNELPAPAQGKISQIYNAMVRGATTPVSAGASLAGFVGRKGTELATQGGAFNPVKAADALGEAGALAKRSPSQIYKDFQDSLLGNVVDNSPIQRIASTINELNDVDQFNKLQYGLMEEATRGQRARINDGVQDLFNRPDAGIDTVRTVNSIPVLKLLKDEGIQPVITRNADGIPKIESLRPIDERKAAYYGQNGLVALKNKLNESGIFLKDYSVGEFIATRRSLGDFYKQLPNDFKTESLNQLTTKLRNTWNETGRGKIDEMLPEGMSLTKADEAFSQTKATIAEWEKAGFVKVTKEGIEFKKPFIDKLTKLSSKGEITDPNIKKALDKFAESQGMSTNELRTEIVYHSTLQEIVKPILKDGFKNDFGSQILGKGGTLAAGYTLAHNPVLGVAGIGLSWLSSQLSSPRSLGYVLKTGLKLKGAGNPITNNLADTVVGRLTNGLALSDDQLKFARTYTKAAFRDALTVGESMLSIYALREANPYQPQQSQPMPQEVQDRIQLNDAMQSGSIRQLGFNPFAQ